MARSRQQACTLAEGRETYNSQVTRMPATFQETSGILENRSHHGVIRRHKGCEDLGHLTRAAPFVSRKHLDRDDLFVSYLAAAQNLEDHLAVLGLFEPVENCEVERDTPVVDLDGLTGLNPINGPFPGLAECGLRNKQEPKNCEGLYCCTSDRDPLDNRKPSSERRRTMFCK